VVVGMRRVSVTRAGWWVRVLDCAEEVHGTNCPLVQISLASKHNGQETHGRGNSHGRDHLDRGRGGGLWTLQ